MFDYYYGDESEQFSFLMIPRVMFTEKETFGSLSNDAKILYAFLHERMTLSRRNGWIDEENRVYIIFTVDEVCGVMNCSHGTAVKLLRELDEDKGIGLIQKKRRGQGKTAIIYVKNFVRSDTGYSVFPQQPAEAAESQSGEPGNVRKTAEVQNLEVLKYKNCTSRSSDFGSQEVQNLNPSYNNINKTDLSYIDFNQSVTSAQVEKNPAEGLIDLNERSEIEKQVCDAIDYECLYPDDETLRSMVTEIKDIMVDVMCGNRNVVIGKRIIPHDAARSAYSKLTSEHITTVLHNILNFSGRISRIDSFIAAVLYNAAFTENLETFTGFTAATGIRLIE